MRHGAAEVILHTLPLCLIARVQQEDCEPGKERGMLSSGRRSSTYSTVVERCWLRHAHVDDDGGVITLANLPDI